MILLGSSSQWLRLLRAVECWLAGASRDDTDTPSLRGVTVGAERKSDFTVGPLVPSTACVDWFGMDCTELKSFSEWVRSFQGEEEVNSDIASSRWVSVRTGVPECCSRR